MTAIDAARRDWIKRARMVPLETVLNGIKLRRVGAELIGPCPKCGGTDRFGVNTRDITFNCRKCGGRGRGSIDLQMFLDGCSLNEAVEKLTGEPPPKSNGNDSGKPHHDAGAWIYHDAAGKPYLKVRRFDKSDGSKFYPQYRWEEGQWLKGKPDGPKIPYRLPELLDSDRTEPVYITEGEKCADAVAKLGLAATSASEGSGKWAADLNEWFRGRIVYILPDADAPGARHAELVAKNLVGVASEVRIVNLPNLGNGGDVFDWIKSGGTREQLEEIGASAPVWTTGNTFEDEDGIKENPEPIGSKNKANALDLWWHGDVDADIGRPFLVEGLLPEVGTAIMSGPWGAYKTFVALDLALSLMRRETFAGRAVNKRCGVLFIAAEGAAEIPIRLQGTYEAHCSDLSPLAFARTQQCTRLLDKKALEILDATAKAAAEHMRAKYGLDLGAIIIDTMAAAAGFDDENSNSEAQRVMNVLTALSQRHKCLVLVADHFGKSAETGTRGGSAKEGSADAVLAILADRDLSGNVSNPRMAVRKMRGAPTGSEIPFKTKVVEMGPDRHGKPQTTLIIEWETEGAPAKKADAWPQNLIVFRDALWNVLAEAGTEQRPFADGPMVRAVDSEFVRAEFYRRYPADADTEERRQEARRKAYSRSVINAQQKHLIGVAVAGKVTLFWAGQRDRRDKG